MAKMARMDGDGVGVNKEVQSSIEKIDEIQNNLDRSVRFRRSELGKLVGS